MIEYRSFRNYDPPKILRLWLDAQLGRGAAKPVRNDESFDSVIYSQHYFDPCGLIIATDDNRPVGYVHAGFGPAADGSNIDVTRGVICAVIVHPEYRRRGIGRELVRRAEAYLKERGSTDITAGAAPKSDPFYFGLYGGAQPAGFLESDVNAAPFFAKLGYVPGDRYLMTLRSLSDRDPVNFRLTMIRRKWELLRSDLPKPCPWWWVARYGRLDSCYCQLIPRGGGAPVAGLTVVGMSLYANSWNEQAIGISDLWVTEGQRRQGYGQTLLVEVIKWLRQEVVTAVTANIPEADIAGQAVFRTSGFQTIDTGIVYRAPRQ